MRRRTLVGGLLAMLGVAAVPASAAPEGTMALPGGGTFAPPRRYRTHPSPPASDDISAKAAAL